MLKLEDYKTIFIVVGFVGSLIIASPILAFVIPKGASETFSELYVLGSNGMAEGYPLNVRQMRPTRSFSALAITWDPQPTTRCR